MGAGRGIMRKWIEGEKEDDDGNDGAARGREDGAETSMNKEKKRTGIRLWCLKFTEGKLNYRRNRK